MRKRIIPTLFCVIFLLTLITQVALGANNVSDINVDVVIYEDGSAYITQTWNGTFYEGTEGYIVVNNLYNMSISDLIVSDINGQYTYLENWNINASFNDKVGKYGIIKTKEGYELCWGLSEYGENRYVIEYKINNVVGAYTDYDGFNFQFINSGMGTLPTDVTLKITMQNGVRLDTDNARVWAFGFNGQINFVNGQVLAFTEEPLSSDRDSVIIMLQLDKGIINPIRFVDKSFEELKVGALKDSDYDFQENSAYDVQEEQKFDFFEFILGILIMATSVFIIFYIFIKVGKRRKKIKELYKNANYFREVPLGSDIEATYVLAKDYSQANDDGNIIGAAFLRLINEGCLEPINEKSVGFFGKEKEYVSLKLTRPPQSLGVTINMLYDLLILASGEDQILQERELEKYSKKNHTAITAIIDATKQEGLSKLRELGSYDNSRQAKPLGLSQGGEKSLQDIMGFKKYLLEFSLIDERGISEAILWQDFLTFATLVGIADKVIEQFKKVYPTPTVYSEQALNTYVLAVGYTKASYYTAHAAAQSARSSGFGGRSSFGGGGGFSGGGSGGGTR